MPEAEIFYVKSNGQELAARTHPELQTLSKGAQSREPAAAHESAAAPSASASQLDSWAQQSLCHQIPQSASIA